MSHWWRAYDQAVDDPKLQCLAPPLFKAWFNLMCIASESGGTLPAIGAVAFKLRIGEHKAAEIIAALVAAGLPFGYLAEFDRAIDFADDRGLVRLAGFEQFDHAWQTAGHLRPFGRINGRC